MKLNKNIFPSTLKEVGRFGVAIVAKFNPNHDELGRFSSADNNTTGKPPLSGEERPPTHELYAPFNYPENTDPYGDIAYTETTAQMGIIEFKYLAGEKGTLYDPDAKVVLDRMNTHSGGAVVSVNKGNEDNFHNISPIALAEFGDALNGLTEQFPGVALAHVGADLSNQMTWGKMSGYSWTHASGGSYQHLGFGQAAEPVHPSQLDEAPILPKLDESGGSTDAGRIEAWVDKIRAWRKTDVAFFPTLHIKVDFVETPDHTTYNEGFIKAADEYHLSRVVKNVEVQGERFAYHVPSDLSPVQALTTHEFGHVVHTNLTRIAPEGLFRIEEAAANIIVGKKVSWPKFKDSNPGDKSMRMERENVATRRESMPLSELVYESERNDAYKYALHTNIGAYGASLGAEAFAELFLEAYGSHSPRPAAAVLKEGLDELWPILQAQGLISKFNPNHDELGRFSSADGAASISGDEGRRLVVQKTLESGLGWRLTPEEQGMVHTAASIEITGLDHFTQARTDTDPSRMVADSNSGVKVKVPNSDRGKIKMQGALLVAQEMTPEEKAAVAAFPAGDWSTNPFPSFTSTEHEFVSDMNSRWAGTAGDSEPAALARQLAAAEAMGWDDERIIREVFHEWEGYHGGEGDIKADYAALKKVAAAAGEGAKVNLSAPGYPLKAWQVSPQLQQNTDETLARRLGFDASNQGDKPTNPVKAAMDAARGEKAAALRDSSHVLVNTLHINNTAGSALKAAVNAGYRRTQKWLKEAGVGETVTLYRGLSYTKGENPFENAMGTTAQSSDNKSSYTAEEWSAAPLSSWSTRFEEAKDFTGAGNWTADGEGVLLKAEVPATDIYGVAALGAGSLLESEILVGGSEFTVEVAYMTKIVDHVYYTKRAGEEWNLL